MKIFVIMPFSETTVTHDEKYWDCFYKKVCDIVRIKNYETIKNLFNVPDFEIYRASAPQGNITKSILIDLKESEVVIAILTDQNPNVFYELGIRHTQSNKTIMLCEKSQKIPFDLSVYGVGFYKDNKFRFRYIEKELMVRFKEIASNRNKPDNPFFDFVISSRGSAELQKPDIKVSIVDQIEGEPLPYPPMFYREALRKGGGEVDYKDRTFFTFIIELVNYDTEPISLFDSKLQVTISSQNFSTDTLYHENRIETAKTSVIIRPKYKKKFTLEPRKIYHDHIAFILDQSVPKEISEICGNVYVIDMFGNEYSSPEIKFAPSPYC